MAFGGSGELTGSVAGRPLLTFRIESPPFHPRTAIMSAAAQKTSASPARVVILISGRGSNMARGITTRALDHRQYPNRAAFDEALANTIDALVPPAQAPWVLLAGFMRVLTASFVLRYTRRLVNIHPALLPAHPGLHTHRQALDGGAMLHGATVHFVTPEVDVGPIIAQAVVPVLVNDTEEVLAARVLEMEHRLFPQVLSWLAAGRITLTPVGGVLLDGEDHPEQRTLLHPLLTGARA